MLLVMILERPRESLRGYCRRFLAEPRANVFVGQATRRLVDDLVERIEAAQISATLIVSSRGSDMGFRMKTFGDPKRTVIDLDGFQVVARKTKR